MKALLLVVSLCVFSLLGENAHAYLQTYEIAEGYFSPASGSGNENLTGLFTVKPWFPPLLLPDGGIIYPNLHSYTYNSVHLSSENHNIVMGTVETLPVPGVVSLGSGHFLLNDQNTLGMIPVILQRSILEHGFDQGREYWRYSEQMLVPVSNPALNYLSYDISGNYYPSNIHFTYELKDSVGKVIETVYPDGAIGLGYDYVTESTTSIGTLTFDAAPVPVPGAVWLLGSGLIGLAGLKRRLVRK